MKKSLVISLGGLLAAFSVVLMFLTNIIPVMSIALPAVAGALLFVAVIEMGQKWAFVIYIAVSILSSLLVTDKSTALFYVLMFGYYPILKSYIERIKSKIVQYLIKYLVFNLSAVVIFLIGYFFMPGMTADLFEYGIAVTIVLAEITFFLYDIALTGLIVQYVTRFRKKFKIGS